MNSPIDIMLDLETLGTTPGSERADGCHHQPPLARELTEREARREARERNDARAQEVV